MPERSYSASDVTETFVRRRLYQDVAEALGLRIISGEYPVGSILPNEAALVRETGCSRTVVREAIKVLTEKGLVQPRPKIGTQVCSRQSWHLLDPDILTWEFQAGRRRDLLYSVTEVRRIIEAEAAALAAERGRDDEHRAIDAALERMEVDIHNNEAFIEHDLEFHHLILLASHNELLERMAETLRIAQIATREVTVQVPGGSEAAMVFHRQVRDAILARDSDEARGAMIRLLAQTRADIDKMLSEQK